MKYFWIIVAIVFIQPLFGQQEASENTNIVYIDLWGAGGYYSFGYERDVPLNNKLGLTVGYGFSPESFWGFDMIGKFAYMPGVQFQMNTYYKIHSHHNINCGINFTTINANEWIVFKSYYNLIFASLGYKYSFLKDRFYVGSNLYLNFYDANGLTLYPWAGLRFGYKFNKLGSSKTAEKPTSGKMQNISATVGPINTKIRVQYEREHNEKTTYGAELTAYFLEFPGMKLEAFGRKYYKKHNCSTGLFLQAKAGIGYLSSGLSNSEENAIWGVNIGVGVAGGYKILLGNHLTLETILGAHFYTPAAILAIPTYGMSTRNEWWFSTTGLPLDYQFKFGWQF